MFTDADAESFEVMHEIWMDMPAKIGSSVDLTVPYVFCRKCGLTESISWCPDHPSADFLGSIKEAVKMFRGVYCEEIEKCLISHCFDKEVSKEIVIKRYLHGKLVNFRSITVICSVCGETEGSYHIFEEEGSAILTYFELFEPASMSCKTIMMRKALG